MTAAADPARRIAVIGAALDLGSGRRGVDMGPSAIRYARLSEQVSALGYEIDDLGNVDSELAEALSEGDPSARYWDAIKATCEQLARGVARAVQAGELPLVLGGDHSIAVGTLGGLAAAHGGPGGLIWFDAHTDLNTPDTSPSGNVHGMPLAVALGMTDDPRFASDAWPLPMLTDTRTVLIGIRSVDEGEKQRLRDLGVHVFTMYDVDRRGIGTIVEEAIELASGGAFLHVSLDMDVVDPEQAPGVGTPVRGGLTYREVQLAMEMLHASGKLRSIEVCEVNPILDRQNRTATLAVELIASALGQTIL